MKDRERQRERVRERERQTERDIEREGEREAERQRQRFFNKTPSYFMQYNIQLGVIGKQVSEGTGIEIAITVSHYMNQDIYSQNNDDVQNQQATDVFIHVSQPPSTPLDSQYGCLRRNRYHTPVLQYPLLKDLSRKERLIGTEKYFYEGGNDQAGGSKINS